MDELTYAIGDVHGRAGALESLLGQIAARGAGRLRRLNFLGDCIDKGPESDRAVAMVRETQAGPRRGDVPDGPSGIRAAASRVLDRDRTLVSNGVARVADLPATAMGWVAGLRRVHEDRLRDYVHAGFRPGRPGIDPSVRARLWIREPFLSVDDDFGKHVVHGHTPSYEGVPRCHPSRTDLDTAPLRTGRLTAAIFDRATPGPIAFLQS